VNDSNRRGVHEDETGRSPLDDDDESMLRTSSSGRVRQIPRTDRRGIQTLPRSLGGWDQDALPDQADAPRLAHDIDPEEDEPTSSMRRFVAMAMLFLVMAAIGSGGATIWYYYGPEWAPQSAQIDETAQTVARLVDEQRRLTQSIAALQLVQDSLQKHISAGEQELQRLSTEVRTLRSDVENLRTAPAGATGHSGNAQIPRSPNGVPSKKKKAESKATAEPKAQGGPMTLSPPPQ
jgi:hypothetical protein